MFLEPFGLLTAIPFPEWVRAFLPAYKATRIIAEVAIEAFLMSLLQSYIYVKVIADVKAGVATPSEVCAPSMVARAMRARACTYRKTPHRRRHSPARW